MDKPTPLLWSSNHPRNFWHCHPDFPPEIWAQAICRALPILGIPGTLDIESALEWTLGEGQFGPHRYHLGLSRRVYYQLKPFIPRILIRLLRQMYNRARGREFLLNWPIEKRFVQFQWEIIRQGLIISGQNEINFRYFWPEGKNFAFVLTHDVEGAEGQRLIPVLADMEESLGFRSLFNFVPERYPLDQGLIKDLRQRGFEIGIHGLKHDGKLFDSYNRFSERATKINRYLRDLKEYRPTGFRSPLTLRNPTWMQILEMDYDLSFFDTDPYEPMPGGTMSIWPFTIGRFLELPYTLPQDYTLFGLFGKTSPRIWLEKIDFLEKYNGMALVIVHPDYSSKGSPKQIYELFLKKVKERGGYWHALPGEVASWWKKRANRNNGYSDNDQQIAMAKIELKNGAIEISVDSESVIPARKIHSTNSTFKQNWSEAAELAKEASPECQIEDTKNNRFNEKLDISDPLTANELRRQALIKWKKRMLDTGPLPLSKSGVRELVHELQIRQIELEIQNENLQRAQSELDESRARYLGLFDLAPVGYCTISENGQVLEANLTAATMLGVERSDLVKKQISNFILREDQDIYYLHCKRLFETTKPQKCELQMAKKDGTSFWVYLDATIVQDANCVAVCRITISDITLRKQKDDELLSMKKSLEMANQNLQIALAREKQLSNTDALTGLCNRRHFFEIAANEFYAATRYKHPLTIILFDMDDFKQINDNLGHLAGDKTLKQVALTAANQLRMIDILARYGGDEFVVLLPQTSTLDAFPVAERIRKSIADQRFAFDKGIFSVSTSLGIAEINHTLDGESIENIIQRADKAMYAAKHEGRNRLSIYNE